ncbi:MAG TPA: hypothetical protein VE135_02610 [Pyrinomonadaceae bacterium]|nr:hypothetical protein [Pyrinomonadaceae bacterium]
MIHFVVPAQQEGGIKDYLDISCPEVRNDFRVLHYESLAEQPHFYRGTYVLSALDQLTSAMGRLVADIHHQLQPLSNIRFLNNPQRTLQRFELLTELYRKQRNEFRAVRAHEDLKTLRFPVFLREERLHDGPISPLLNSAREVRQAIGRALVQGHELNNLLVVEFCDTAEHGVYRKYAAFVVGRNVIPRSLNYGRHWMLKHSETEFSRAVVVEELEYVTTNPHQKQLSEIFELAQVEYGRIDYAMKDGRVQTWEINLNPTIGRGLRPRSRNIPAELDAIRDEVRSEFYSGFRRAWREVNLCVPAEPLVRINLDPQIRSTAKPITFREDKLLGSIRSVLRPFKPLMERLSPPFLFVLGWLASLFGGRRSQS